LARRKKDRISVSYSVKKAESEGTHPHCKSTREGDYRDSLFIALEGRLLKDDLVKSSLF
jgi:hypothetical protein